MTVAVPVLREVRLYGQLGREFGRVFRLAVATPAEAVRALCAVLPGFERAFVGPDGRQAYHVYVGSGPQRRNIGEAEAAAPLGQREPIRLVPVVMGGKRQGLGQTIVGAVLLVVGVAIAATSIVTGGTTAGLGFAIANMGLAMMLGGVVQMLSPQRTGKTPAVENLPSYAFDGALNNAEQGGPVPVGYGRCIIGSVVVSQGLSTTELVVPSAYGDGGATMPPPPELPPYEEGNG
jgi:predicted phage tail protein